MSEGFRAGQPVWVTIDFWPDTRKPRTQWEEMATIRSINRDQGTVMVTFTGANMEEIRHLTTLEAIRPRMIPR